MESIVVLGDIQGSLYLGAGPDFDKTFRICAIRNLSEDRLARFGRRCCKRLDFGGIMGGCVMFRSDAPGESFGEGSYGITLVIANRVGDACNITANEFSRHRKG